MSTPNLELPLVPANSLQPSVVINEALQILDAITQLAVQDKDLAAPPATLDTDTGKVWIIAAGATGAWTGHDQDLALCTGAGLWRFIEPRTGFRGYVIDDAADYRYVAGAWTLV